MATTSTRRAQPDATPAPTTPRARKSPSKPEASGAETNQPGKIPVSAFPPVALARPLEVFGATFLVHISTWMTLSPDTIALVVVDSSLQTLLRTNASDKFQNLRKLLYLGTGKHKLRPGSENLYLSQFKLLGDPAALAAVMKGQEPPPQPLESDWKAIVRGMDARAPNCCMTSPTTWRPLMMERCRFVSWRGAAKRPKPKP